MQQIESGSFYFTLGLLLQKGIRYSTVVDVGCADGSFFMSCLAMGILPDAVPLNIDANELYRDSLKAIKDVVGGDYRICAATDHEGEIELTMSAHPYWSSLRPEGDIYWQRINQLRATTVKVPATKLDTLRHQLGLKPPFLLKLDVQGAEASVLRGASKLLEDTHVVICEADLDDFQDLNAALTQHGFELYDATHLSRLRDGSLGWFHPIYINRKIESVRPKNFWDSSESSGIIQSQQTRRQAILQSNAEILRWIQQQKKLTTAGAKTAPAIATRRNERCHCGSGLKYKHCCGANT